MMRKRTLKKAKDKWLKRTMSRITNYSIDYVNMNLISYVYQMINAIVNVSRPLKSNFVCAFIPPFFFMVIFYYILWVVQELFHLFFDHFCESSLYLRLGLTYFWPIFIFNHCFWALIAEYYSILIFFSISLFIFPLKCSTSSFHIQTEHFMINYHYNYVRLAFFFLYSVDYPIYFVFSFLETL